MSDTLTYAVPREPAQLLGPLHLQTVRRLWDDFIEPEVKRVVESDPELGLTVESIAKSILHGVYQVWVLRGPDNTRGVVLTSVRTRDDGQHVWVVNMCAGDGVLNHVELLWDVFKAHGQMNGCSAMEILGRAGWGKALKKLGFRGLYWAQTARI